MLSSVGAVRYKVQNAMTVHYSDLFYKQVTATASFASLPAASSSSLPADALLHVDTLSTVVSHTAAVVALLLLISAQQVADTTASDIATSP